MNLLDAIRALGRPTAAPRPTATRSAASGFDGTLEALLAPPGEEAPVPVEAHAEPEAPPSLHLAPAAAARHERRGDPLDPTTEARLDAALEHLEHQGSRRALLLEGERAWVADVPARSLERAMSRSEALDGLFVDWDSTFVIADR